MEDTLISFETAKLAKEKGFDFIYIVNNKLTKYSLITQSLLQKWLREVHKIIVLVDWEGTDGYFYKLDFKSYYEVAGDNNKKYEDCLELGLQEALKLI